MATEREVGILVFKGRVAARGILEIITLSAPPIIDYVEVAHCPPVGVVLKALPAVVRSITQTEKSCDSRCTP